MIGLCTDSNAQLPPWLRDRYGIEVVPLDVTVDGRSFLEGVDLDAEDFYGYFANGHQPQVATAAPAPGRVAAAYERLVARGATEILSVHVGSDVSATCDSARLAGQHAAVPVRLVDTGTASFAVGCAVWEAADAIERGATVAEAAELAESTGSRCGNVFTVGSLDLARAGGRLAPDAAPTGVPILALTDGRIRPVGSAISAADAVRVMAAEVQAAGAARVGVGHADAASASLADELEAHLAVDPTLEVVRYRIGPSVGAHTGPGTVGAVFYAVG